MKIQCNFLTNQNLCLKIQLIPARIERIRRHDSAPGQQEVSFHQYPLVRGTIEFAFPQKESINMVICQETAFSGL